MNEAVVPYMDLEELTVIFGYTNIRASQRHIRTNRFPVRTFRLAGNIVATTRSVQNYFDEQDKLNEEGASSDWKMRD